MPSRRSCLCRIAASLAAVPLAALAQGARPPYRIGWLTPADIIEPERVFRAAMASLGYVEGKTAVFETRSAEDDVSRLPGLAAQLVRAKVDVIVAVSPWAITAARKATGTIPIVMAFWGGGGLVESGLVQSLARPGGSVTGISMLAAELEAKRLELLLQATPGAKRVGMLWPGPGFESPEAEAVAKAAGVALLVTPVPDGSDGYRRAFATIVAGRADALLVPSFPRFFRDARQIIDLAAAERLPAIYEWPSMAADGGLIAYGPRLDALEARVASFVDRILKGAKPGDLPIEQPTTFELVVNRTTAKAMGITIPASFVLRADRVIG